MTDFYDSFDHVPLKASWSKKRTDETENDWPTVTAVRTDRRYFTGYAHHALRYYVQHPNANLVSMDPVTRQDWLAARSTLSESPRSVAELYRYWSHARLCLDEAAALVGARHHHTKQAMLKADRAACRLFAIKRGLLWDQQDTDMEVEFYGR